MKTETHLRNIVDSIEQKKAAYDKNVKELLADRQILARIVKYTVKEVEHLSVEEIMQCIDRNSIEVGKTAVDPGLTNYGKTESVQTEDTVANEGYILFDIRFPLIYGEKQIKIIINIEAQRSMEVKKLGYHLENRMIYYLSRLISSQKQTEFFNSDYDSIKKVYSIWICMETGKEWDSISRIALRSEHLYGKEYEFTELDKMCGIVVQIGNKKRIESKNRLIEMLEDLLRDEEGSIKKKKLIEKYDMKMEVELEGRVEHMCNLSDWVEERGIERGVNKERMRTIQKMLEKGYEKEEILEFDYTETEYEQAKKELCENKKK